MKNTFLVLILSFCCFQATAQLGKMLKSIDISMGVDEDRVNNLGHEYFADMVRDENVSYDGPAFDNQSAYSMICENPYIRVMATLAPVGSQSTELRVGVNSIFNRLDGVSYRNNEGAYSSFSTIGDEIALETAFIKTTGIGGLRLYGGVGTNTGFAFNNRYYAWGNRDIIVDNVSLRGQNQPIADVMQVSDNYHDDVELRNGISQRLFLQAGVGLRFFKRIEFGLEGRYGYGYRWIGGTSPHAIRLQSVALNARYYLKKQGGKRTPFKINFDN